MGNKQTTPMPKRQTPNPDTRVRADLIPDASHLGPQFCKSCWFERKGLVACNNHYLCMNCLTLLLTVSERCPICKLPLPHNVKLNSMPTAPPEIPPPYEP
ncbi:Z protein [Arenaviridae sp. 13ZR68]|uniref:RING finger protein Z n=1 Tax=Arenaviridae sp. 13ZR68 TaxID=1518603 RepID=A0A0U5AWQ3_9VIRU|nr:Z protein [Arenaviridae sp. 13ZR68]BAU22153.1 Z protein [Arenaviridae sp. 13ZR68]